MALLSNLCMKKATWRLFFYKTACGLFEKVESFFTYLTKGLTLLSSEISPFNALSNVST